MSGTSASSVEEQAAMVAMEISGAPTAAKNPFAVIAVMFLPSVRRIVCFATAVGNTESVLDASVKSAVVSGQAYVTDVVSSTVTNILLVKKPSVNVRLVD